MQISFEEWKQGADVIGADPETVSDRAIGIAVYSILAIVALNPDDESDTFTSLHGRLSTGCLCQLGRILNKHDLPSVHADVPFGADVWTMMASKFANSDEDAIMPAPPVSLLALPRRQIKVKEPSPPTPQSEEKVAQDRALYARQMTALEQMSFLDVAPEVIGKAVRPLWTGLTHNVVDPYDCAIAAAGLAMSLLRGKQLNAAGISMISEDIRFGRKHIGNVRVDLTCDPDVAADLLRTGKSPPNCEDEREFDAENAEGALDAFDTLTSLSVKMSVNHPRLKAEAFDGRRESQVYQTEV
jgi:hypothetical protein